MDRPYASVKYFGRAKYRIYRHGHFRMMSQLKIGSVGSLAPNAIQSVIHRDITIGSYRPQGWGSQIAAGGRIALSYEFFPEYMLVSKNWFLYHVLSEQMKFKGHELLNISLPGEFKFGHDMTSAGIGISFATADFKRTGGNNVPFVESKSKSKFVRAFNYVYFNYKFMYRHVFHNSMLEGYGITKHGVDEDPGSPVDRHFLEENEMIRDVFIHEVSLNFKLRYCALFIKNTFMSPEYNLPVNSLWYNYGEFQGPGNHNTHPWNFWGTIGLLFKV
jgi:hypothetical protein